MSVTVVIPTVAARLDFCAATVNQWHAHGYQPLVTRTPADRSPSPWQNTLTMQAALRAGLATAASTLIFCEDDVLLSPDAAAFARVIQRCQRLGELVTLYLPGTRFYSAAVQRAIAQECLPPAQIVAVRNQRHWIGSQCLVMPRDLAESVVAATPVRDGDRLIRETVLARGRCLYAVVPNVVQHRAPPSVTSPRYRSHTSATYRWRKAWSTSP